MRRDLGAGRAGEPGRLAVHGPQPDATSRGHRLARICRPAELARPSARKRVHERQQKALDFAAAFRPGRPTERCTSPIAGIEELEQRRGDEEVTLAWVAERLRTFVDLNPDFEVPVERLATWLAPVRRRGRLTRP